MRERLEETYQIISDLREGCPADKARDAKSLLKDVGGELQEVAMAIGSGDLDNLSEEIGDLLFTVLFLARVCEKDYDIEMDKILSKLNNKMVFRHPHVFEEPRSVTIAEAERLWQEKKREERELKIVH